MLCPLQSYMVTVPEGISTPCKTRGIVLPSSQAMLEKKILSNLLVLQMLDMENNRFYFTKLCLHLPII